MSKQKGLIKLEGNIGGISFYQSAGEFLARTASGPSKQRIASDPAFKRTRENNMEFGASATVAKAFRTSLSGVLQSMASSQLVSRLTKLFKSINLKANGVRGQRPIELSKNKEMLLNFNFNSKLSFSSVFNAPYKTLHTAQRNQAAIEVAAFVPGDFIKAPVGATHFRIVNALGVLSDYAFDGDVNSYEAIKPALNSRGAVGYTELYSLTDSSVSFNLGALLDEEPGNDNKLSVIQCMGIEFFQVIGGNQYLLAQGNAMKVVDVF